MILFSFLYLVFHDDIFIDKKKLKANSLWYKTKEFILKTLRMKTVRLEFYYNKQNNINTIQTWSLCYWNYILY